jgi:hypothetical protein
MGLQTARWNVWTMLQPGKKKERTTTQNVEKCGRRWRKWNVNKNRQAVATETIRNEESLYRKPRSKMDCSAWEERGGGGGVPLS